MSLFDPLRVARAGLVLLALGPLSANGASAHEPAPEPAAAASATGAPASEREPRPSSDARERGPREPETPETPAADPERAAELLAASYQAEERRHWSALEARRAAGAKDEGSAKPVPAHPATLYWDRFEALAKEKSGRAALWLATHVALAHPARAAAENRAQALLLHERMLEHADAPWIREWTRSLSAAYLELDAGALDQLVERFAAKSHDREAVAEALYRSAAEGKRSKREGAPERARAIEARLAKEFGDTEFGRRAGGDDAIAVGLSVGKRAPDFTTTDADGKEFKLSDYRGKVVVLDFWGFW